METFRGNLLIGGMCLKHLDGAIEGDATAASEPWTGHFALDRTEAHCLQVGRPYRLQLDDGRAAQVVVARMEVPLGHVRLLVEFEGRSPLTGSPQTTSP